MSSLQDRRLASVDATRARLEAAIATAIELLDRLDGDTDFEVDGGDDRERDYDCELLQHEDGSTSITALIRMGVY